MKKSISAILLLFIATSTISSCYTRETNSNGSSQTNSYDPVSNAYQVYESSDVDNTSKDESQISYLEKYEIYESYADGALHLVMKPISDNEFETEFYTALVREDGKVLYDFDQDVWFSEIKENRFIVYSKDFTKAGLIDDKGDEIIPFGAFKYIINSIYEPWLYGIRADGFSKVLNTDGIMLEYDFSTFSALCKNQFGVVYNGKKHILILNNDGTHELFEHDYEADLEKNKDVVLDALNKFFTAVRDGDEVTIKKMMTAEGYKKLQEALKNKELADIPVEDWNSHYGIELLAILSLNKDEVAGAVTFRELMAANIEKDGISGGEINLILDNDWRVIFSLFTLVSDGNGNFTLTYLDGKLE